MTHLRIENQNSNTEIVSAAIILKIYEMALSAEGDVSLKGNLLSDHAKLTAYDYLTGNLTGTSTKRFPLLYINVTGGLYVDFADPVVELKLTTKFGDGTGVTISDVTGNLTESWGFKNNTNITSFDELGLFTNVTKFNNGEYVFLNCSNLQSIDLRNITEIGSTDSDAFRNCTSLLSVGDTSGLLIVGAGAFRGCTSLSSIDLSNVTSIGQNAFSGCTSLTSIDLSNVTSIGSSAFSGCTGLTTVIGLSSLDAKNLGFNTFNNCTNLGINLDLILNTTGSGTFPAATFVNTGYKSITVNAPNITTFYSRSVDVFFRNMKNVVKADFSNTGITNMSSIASLTSINTAIYPNTLTSMDWLSLSVPSSLLYLVILATNPPTLEHVQYANLRSANVYVPDASLSSYQSAQYWSDSKVVNHLKPLSELPSSVTWVTQTT